MLQFHGAMRHCFEANDCKRPLFQSKVKRMVDAFEKAGQIFDSDRPLDEQVWLLLSQRKHFSKPRYRVTLNRFGGGVTRATEIIDDWVFDEFETEYLGLEMDFLRGKAYSSRIRLKKRMRCLVFLVLLSLHVYNGSSLDSDLIIEQGKDYDYLVKFIFCESGERTFVYKGFNCVSN